MKQMRLKDLCVGQYFTMGRNATKFTRVYKVVSKNLLATLCVDFSGNFYSFKNSIVVHLQFIQRSVVPFQMTNDFVDYLNSVGYIVYCVSYGFDENSDEVFYI